MNNNNVIIKKRNKIKQKGYADVVFVVDKSGSMSGVIRGLIDHIGDFINGLNSGNYSLSWRIALIGEDDSQIQFADFSDSKESLRQSLSRISLGGSEASYQALDFATSLEFRGNCKKIVVFFTDEPLSGGSYYSESSRNTQDLAQKFNDGNIKFFLYTPHCRDYQNLSSQINSAFHEDFRDINRTPFDTLLENMGKTISSWNYQGGDSTKLPLIFKDILNRKITITNI